MAELAVGAGRVHAVRALGTGDEVRFEQGKDALTLHVPSNRATPYATVLEVEGAL